MPCTLSLRLCVPASLRFLYMNRRNDAEMAFASPTEIAAPHLGARSSLGTVTAQFMQFSINRSGLHVRFEKRSHVLGKAHIGIAALGE